MSFPLSNLINKLFHKHKRRNIVACGILGYVRTALNESDIQLSMYLLKLRFEFL